jgi:hypothetical protein
MIENDFQLENTRAKQADLQELLDQKRNEQPASLASKLTIQSLQRRINRLTEEMQRYLAHRSPANSG